MSAVLGRSLEQDGITQTPQCGVSCFFSAKVPMKGRLKKGGLWVTRVFF